MILVSLVLQILSSALPLEAGFRDSSSPPGLSVHADDKVGMGPAQRRLVRNIARVVSGMGYSSRGALFTLPARGEKPEARVVASTDGIKILPVRLVVDLAGDAPRVVRADTTHSRQYSAADSTRLDLATTYFVEGRYADAQRELEPLVAKGYPEALYLRGGALRDGLGVPLDCKAAEAFLLRAIDSGVTAAHAAMGRLLLDGACVVPRRPSAAFQHLVEATERGVVSSMTFIGMELMSGRSLPRSIPMGVFNLNAAAANRDPEARELVADMRKKVGPEQVERAINEGRLRWEIHHFGFTPMPVAASCRIDVGGDSVVPCAVRSGILLRMEHDANIVDLPDDASQRILLQVARGQIDEASAAIRDALGCLQVEALDVYDILKAQVPELPATKSPPGSVLPM